MYRGGGRGNWRAGYRGGGGGFRGRSRGGRYGGERSTGDADRDDDGGSSSDGSMRSSSSAPVTNLGSSGDVNALKNFLMSVDGSNYGQLKWLTGKSYCVPTPNSSSGAGATGEVMYLTFNAIQSDPFAPGSQLCVTFPWRRNNPEGLLNVGDNGCETRRIAVEDFILRCFHSGVAEERQRVAQFGSALQVLRPSQHVIARSAVQLERNTSSGGGSSSSSSSSYMFHFYLRAKLPGHGRRIDSRGVMRILFDDLLPAVSRYMLQHNTRKLEEFVVNVHEQEWLRGQLINGSDSGGGGGVPLAAFVIDGAVLPRAAGDADRPLESDVVPFRSPPSLSRSFTLPFSGRTITGMGIPRGLTLIAGGGFHGKSTLLRALEVGVYNHVPDDGRAFVVVDPTAVKIRAEDRRSVQGVDISPFINNLPFGRTTNFFQTADASGSTSQAANIVESLELGSTLLLLDEDTCATNLMYRDHNMQQLVARENEPITPLVERAQELVQAHNVSFVVVVGGSGQYFAVADTVIAMTSYEAHDVSARAKEIVAASSRQLQAQQQQQQQVFVSFPPFDLAPNRRIDFKSTFSFVHLRPGRDGTKISGQGKDAIRFSDELIDVAFVEQLVEEGQVNAIAQCLARIFDGGAARMNDLMMTTRSANSASHSSVSPFCSLVMACASALKQARLELRSPSYYAARGFTSEPRPFEIGAALNRLRPLRLLPPK